MNQPSFTIIVPKRTRINPSFARFYFKPDGHTPFVGAGFLTASGTAEPEDGDSESYSTSGFTAEGGFNWRWNAFTMDLGDPEGRGLCLKSVAANCVQPVVALPVRVSRQVIQPVLRFWV